MILADTSVWIDNFRSPNPELLRHAQNRQLLMHPLVVGELAMGTLAQREAVILDLSRIVRPHIATNRETMTLIESERLWGIGLGYIDASLLASTLLTESCQLWTRDRRMHEVAERLGVAYSGTA